MPDHRLMRDSFIDAVTDEAKKRRDIFFLSADFGAAALDRLRRDLPQQFIHTGICEQNMIDIAAGLALAGKTVFAYAMAPFITARCYEQTKAVLAAMNLPVTLVGVGAGLGYDHATLTHFTPEDIACMRALNHLEVVSPGDAEAAAALAGACCASPRFRYVRLERQAMPALYRGRFATVLPQGFAELAGGRDVAIGACGYLVHKALRAREALQARRVEAGVIDLFRLKPVDAAALVRTLQKYEAIVTVEEQLLEGGFGSLVLEVLADAGIGKRVRRLGLRDGFAVVNGHRDHLHALYGIDTPDIAAAALSLATPRAAA
jgi:transketolase